MESCKNLEEQRIQMVSELNKTIIGICKDIQESGTTYQEVQALAALVEASARIDLSGIYQSCQVGNIRLSDALYGE